MWYCLLVFVWNFVAMEDLVAQNLALGTAVPGRLFFSLTSEGQGMGLGHVSASWLSGSD